MTVRRLLAAAAFAVATQASATTEYGPLVIVAPTVSEAWPESSDTVELELEFSIGRGGEPTGVQLLSKPTAFDAELLRAIDYWRYVPPFASSCALQDHRVTQRIRMERRDGGASIVIREPELSFASRREPRQSPEPGTHVTDDLGRERIIRRYYELHYPDLRFNRTSRALLIVQLAISPKGDVIDVNVPFSFPTNFFEATLERRIKSWQFDPLSDGADGRDGRICMQIRFEIENADRHIDYR